MATPRADLDAVMANLANIKSGVDRLRMLKNNRLNAFPQLKAYIAADSLKGNINVNDHNAQILNSIDLKSLFLAEHRQLEALFGFDRDAFVTAKRTRLDALNEVITSMEAELQGAQVKLAGDNSSGARGLKGAQTAVRTAHVPTYGTNLRLEGLRQAQTDAQGNLRTLHRDSNFHINKLQQEITEWKNLRANLDSLDFRVLNSVREQVVAYDNDIKELLDSVCNEMSQLLADAGGLSLRDQAKVINSDAFKGVVRWLRDQKPNHQLPSFHNQNQQCISAVNVCKAFVASHRDRQSAAALTAGAGMAATAASSSASNSQPDAGAQLALG